MSRRRVLLLTGLGCVVLAAWAVDVLWDAAVLSHAQHRYGEAARARVASWLALIARLRHASETEKLHGVNEFFNRVPNRDDRAQWGVRDYWATPLEVLGRWGGDCEDFVIAKYFTLRELGVPDERLRLVYARAYRPGRIEPHMVLAYLRESGGEPWLLDNLRPEIVPASSRPDLVPTYSFLADRIWAAKQRSRGILTGDGAGMWSELRALLTQPAASHAAGP